MPPLRWHGSLAYCGYDTRRPPHPAAEAPRAGLLERPRPGHRHRRRARARHGPRRARRGGPPGASALAGRPTGGVRARPEPRPRPGRRRRSTPASAAACAPPAAGCAPRTGAGCGARIEDSPAGPAAWCRRVNGLIGDRLAEQQSELAITTGGAARRGRDVPLEPEALAEAFPAATADVVVFLHGLGEAESHWDRRRAGRPAAATATGWPRRPPGRRSTCAPTPACRSRRTASRWPRCSTTWSPPGRPRYAGSRWSGTRWAGWSCAPPARS